LRFFFIKTEVLADQTFIVKLVKELHRIFEAIMQW